VRRSQLFNEYTDLVEGRYIPLRRVFFCLAFLLWVWYYANNSLLHQVGHNPLEFQDIDPTYWILMWLNLPGLFNGVGAYIIDAFLLLSCLGSILFMHQQITTRIFFCCSFLYFVYYNLWSGHHHINTGLFLMSFPFIFSNPIRFTYSFAFCRFVFCSMLAIAAFWKMARGNLWHIDQGAALLLLQFKNQLFETTSFRSKMLLLVVQHPLLGYALWTGMILLELAFVIGLITWKKDRLLLGCYLLFFIGGWLFFDLYFIENLLFLLSLAPLLRLLPPSESLREKQQLASL
jgi:hypothetical protein